MREAKFVGLAVKLEVADLLSVRLVSYRAQIKEIISTHLLYIYFDAS